jgi:hypothetical protein
MSRKYTVTLNEEHKYLSFINKDLGSLERMGKPVQKDKKNPLNFTLLHLKLL